MNPKTQWIKLGYMAKHVVNCPEWLKASHIQRVCSVSSCVSEDFSDFIQYWKHNGYWMFNTLESLLSLCKTEKSPLQALSFFYYEAYPKQYDAFSRVWSDFQPESSFDTHVIAPQKSKLLGYDVVSFEAQNTPECSYLSCNHMAETLECNSDCLFGDFESAFRAIIHHQFEGCEPGPMRIIAVHELKVKTSV